MVKIKYTTIGQLGNVGEVVALGESSLNDDDEEVRLEVVAVTRNGNALVQVDIRDSYGNWDSHCDFDMTVGKESIEFFDINSGELFETYSGYGILLTKEEWKTL